MIEAVVRHNLSLNRHEVDKLKVEDNSKTPHPTSYCPKESRSFLGHAGFYRRFIQDFSKIARPMTHLLEKETPFFFSEECIDSFNTLKRKLTEAPILIAPDWDLPFELMKVQLNELNELRDQAYENSLIYKEKTKRIHDARSKTAFSTLVIVSSSSTTRQKICSGKLKSRWSGPFTIVQVFPYGTVELSQNSGPNFKVNGHRIKHYLLRYVPTEVVPRISKRSAWTNKSRTGQASGPLNSASCGGGEFPDCEDSRTCSIPQRVSHPQLQFGNPHCVRTRQYLSMGDFGTDNQEKDEKQSQNDKTGLGMEKTVKDKAKSKPERSVKFLEVPAASLVQAIEKNLSAFVVNVIGDPLINIVKDGGIISDIIWNDDVVSSCLDVAVDPNINEGPLKYDDEEDESGSGLHLSKRNLGRFHILIFLPPTS
ncbi:hypothetical protein Tco_0427717 [Tanacetum coccineum]